MIDQYIYTRVDGSGNRKEFGHGLAERTDGIPSALEKEIATIARYKNTTTDGQGNRVKIFEKRNLGDTPLVALQQTVRFPERSSALDLAEGDPRLLYISSTNRVQFLSHGLVCNISDRAMVNPDQWFYRDFVDYNVNLKKANLQELPKLEENATQLEPLRVVLGKAGLSLENFITAVRASFDAENWDTIVLIELDYSRPDAYALGEQLLRWIYHFLPFSMRRFADFSSCYDLSCGGYDFALALIPSAMLQQDRGGRITFQGMPNSVKYGYLLTGERCMHQKLSGRPDFDSSVSLYAQWIEQVIRTVYQQEKRDGELTLGRLFEIYGAFDSHIASEETSHHCRTELYDALLWLYLQNGIGETPHIDSADRAVSDPESASTKYYEVLLSLQDQSLILPQIPALLEKASAAAASGDDASWLKLLCTVRDKLGNDAAIQTVQELHLARILDTAPPHTVREAVEAFFHTVSVERDSDKRAMLEHVFFPTVHLPSDGHATTGGASPKECGMNRAKLWFDSMITERNAIEPYLQQVKRLFQTLAGFAPEHVQVFLQNGLIPTIRIPDADFSDLALVLNAKEEFQEAFSAAPQLSDAMNRVFDGLQDTILGFCNQRIKRLRQSPSELTDLLQQMLEALLPVSKMKEGKEYAQSYFSNCILTWSSAVSKLCAKPKTDEDAWTPALKNAPDLHRVVGKVVDMARQVGVEKKWLSTLYDPVCIFMVEGAYAYRTVGWYLEFSEVSDAYDLCPLQKMAAQRCYAVSRYLHQERLDYPSFQPIAQKYAETCGQKKGAGLEKASLALLNPVIELFDKNELPRLEAEMLAYASVLEALTRRDDAFFSIEDDDVSLHAHEFHAHGGRRPHQQTQRRKDPNRCMIAAFSAILEQKGCRALLQLLDRYPSAPGMPQKEVFAEETRIPAKRENGTNAIQNAFSFVQKVFQREAPDLDEQSCPRAGAYDWMETNNMLLMALEESIDNKRDILYAEMQQDEMLCPDFVTAVFNLAPPQSVLDCRSVNTELYRLWEASRPKNPTAKKAMNELSKKGAYYPQKSSFLSR